MLTVPVVVITMPNGSGRGVSFQKRVDHADGIGNTLVVSGPKAKAHQGERIWAHNSRARQIAVTRWPVLYGHEAILRRGRVRDVRWRDTDVVTADTQLTSEIRVDYVCPVFDQAVPRICCLSDICGRSAGAMLISEVS